MNNPQITKCTRCGKLRIIAKTWTEARETRVGTATVSYTTSVCPDPDCQKIVEEGFAREHQIRMDAIRLKEYQMLHRHNAARAKKKETPPLTKR